MGALTTLSSIEPTRSVLLASYTDFRRCTPESCSQGGACQFWPVVLLTQVSGDHMAKGRVRKRLRNGR